MSERSAREANGFPVPMLPIPRAWPEDRPDQRPESTAEPERLTFFGMWRHALGFGSDR